MFREINIIVHMIIVKPADSKSSSYGHTFFQYGKNFMGTQNSLATLSQTHVMLFVMAHHRDHTVSHQSEVQEQIVLEEMMLQCHPQPPLLLISLQVMKWANDRCL